LLVAVMSSSPFVWKAWHTVTANLVVMNQRYALPLIFVRYVYLLLQLFPGLIYRMIKPKVVLLIFVSGKIVLTGAKVCGFFLLTPSDLLFRYCRHRILR
jgi:hypothetical protein